MHTPPCCGAPPVVPAPAATSSPRSISLTAGGLLLCAAGGCSAGAVGCAGAARNSWPSDAAIARARSSSSLCICTHARLPKCRLCPSIVQYVLGCYLCTHACRHRRQIPADLCRRGLHGLRSHWPRAIAARQRSTRCRRCCRWLSMLWGNSWCCLGGRCSGGSALSSAHDD